MPFRPAGTDHAIVSNSFTIGVDGSALTEAIAQLGKRKNRWSDSLPAVREMQQLEVQVRPDGASTTRNSPAVEFAFLRPNGTPTWIMRFDRTDILVECTLYTRWEQVWTQAGTLLSQAMSALASTGAKANTFAMQVVDRFESDIPNDRASTIFSADATIDSRLRDLDELWHQHVGWLEQTPSGELLHNVNIDVLPREVDGAVIGRAVNLLHLQRVKLSSPIAFVDDEAANLSELAKAAVQMHDLNKTLLRATLSEPLRKDIQLDAAI